MSTENKCFLKLCDCVGWIKKKAAQEISLIRGSKQGNNDINCYNYI